jgi:uncharacterized protein (UPF0335 family)
MLDQTNQQLVNDKKLLMDKVQNLNDDLLFHTRAGGMDKDAVARIESLRKERDASKKKEQDLMHQINTMSQ